MYYLVDKESLKIIYSNQETLGIKGNSLDQKNVRYTFGENLELESLGIKIYGFERAFVLTKDGYREFMPSYVIDSLGYAKIYSTIFSIKYIEKNIEKLKSAFKEFNNFVPICSGYICIDYPEKANHVMDNDFFIEYITEWGIEEDNNVDVHSTEKTCVYRIANQQ